MKGLEYYTHKINQSRQFKNDCRITLSPSETKVLFHIDPTQHTLSVSLSEYEIIRKGNQNE